MRRVQGRKRSPDRQGLAAARRDRSRHLSLRYFPRDAEAHRARRHLYRVQRARALAAGAFGAHFPGSVYCSQDEVCENVERAGYPFGRFHFIEGMVEKTIPHVVPDRIALLRLDTDYYESTKHERGHLFPRLVRGGVLIIDDYGAF